MKELSSCIVILHKTNNSNCKQHILARHKDDLFGKKFHADNDSESAVGSSKTSSISRTVFLEGAGSGAGAGRGGSDSVGGSYFARVKNPKWIVEKANELQLQLMRACNIAAHHGNSPEFQRFVDHIVDHSHYFSQNRGSMLMGRRKLSNQRYHSFNKLLYVVRRIVGNTRVWMCEQTKAGSSIPFITVGHDGWDSKDKDMLGVSIHLVDIEKAKKVTIAVGLQQLHSKKAVDVAEHVLKILQRYVDCSLSVCICSTKKLYSDTQAYFSMC
jgi:hypothetical protein